MYYKLAAVIWHLAKFSVQFNEKATHVATKDVFPFLPLKVSRIWKILS